MKNIKTLYLIAALFLSSCALAMEEWDPVLTTVTTASPEQELSLLEELPLELLRMIYDKLDPDSKRAFLAANKRLYEVRNPLTGATLKGKAGIPSLLRMEGLKDLKIAYTVSRQDILDLQPVLKNVKVLDTSNNLIMNEDFEVMVPYLTQLEQLDLSSNLIPDETLSYLRGLTQLLELNLSGCTRISLSGIQHLSALLPQLQVLNLSGCNVVDFMAAMYLARFTQLRELNLSDCISVRWQFLEQLAKLPQLQVLDISNNQAVDDTDLRTLERCTQLRRLDVRGTHVTSAGIAALQVALPDLEISYDPGRIYLYSILSYLSENKQ